jgi:hypothetical protein
MPERAEPGPAVANKTLHAGHAGFMVDNELLLVILRYLQRNPRRIVSCK